MDKLWEFIEHLAPGLLIVAVALEINLLNPKYLYQLGTSGSVSELLFVATAYIIGVFNSSLSRFLYTEFPPIMDMIRGFYFGLLVKRNQFLKVYVSLLYSKLDSTNNPINDSRFGSFWNPYFNRAIFHTVSGYSQGKDMSMAKEISDRRREARLLRSIQLPSYFLFFNIMEFCTAFWLSILLVCSYWYREASIADSIEHSISSNTI